MKTELIEVNNVPVMIIDNFFTEEEIEEILDTFEIVDLQSVPDHDSTTAYDPTIQTTLKSAKSFWIGGYNSPYGKEEYFRGLRVLGNKLSELFHTIRTDEELMNNVPAFRPMTDTMMSISSLVAYYGDGDYYKSHTDSCSLTFLIWICRHPKKFEGGDYLIEGVETIKFRNNRIILAPGYLSHEITKIKMKEEDYRNGYGRWSVATFAAHRESSPEEREMREEITEQLNKGEKQQ